MALPGVAWGNNLPFSRPAVSYYAPQPGPRYVPPRQQQQPRPVFQPARAAPAPDWSPLEAFANSDAGQAQIAKVQQQQQQPQEEGGFWSGGIGKGLGFIINNPVTKTITEPLKYIDVGRKLAVLGVEEGMEALPDWAEKLGPIGGMLGMVDTERTEADKRSNWEKLNPNSDYGFGQLLDEDNPAWLNRAIGFAGDVGLDPLTYATAGASRLVSAGSHVDEAARALTEAGEALKVAQEAGKARDISKAVKAVTAAEDYVARAPSMGERVIEQALPHNRTGRVNFFSELAKTPEGQQLLNEMPEQVQRGGQRGLQAMSQEAKDILRISDPALKMFGQRVPGTGKLAEALVAGGGATRVGLGKVPYAEKIASIRVPKGLRPSYNVLTRGQGGDVFLEASMVALANSMREGTGAQLSRGNRIISKGIKDYFKGLDDDALNTLRREAETLPESNGINEMLRNILDTYEKVTGRQIDPEFLRNRDTYLPHLLDPHFRRALGRMAKDKNQSALDFIKHLGLVEDDLLEEPTKFFADNLMEPSGFISKARKFGTNRETGEAQTFKIGGKDITFEADDVDHLNEQLHKAFPEYKGDFYDTNPVRIMEAYNKSLSRQAGRDLASRHLREVGNPLVKELTGDIDATRIAMNEALSQQGAAPLLSTAQGKYDPNWLSEVSETPIVPGSYEERAPIEKLRAAAEETTDAAERDVLNAEADRLQAEVTASRIGGVEPSDYFVTSESNTAAQEATRAHYAAAKRGKTFATAIGGETRAAETTLRKAVAETRGTIINPLKTAVADTKKEIVVVNKKLRTWAKTVADWGPLTADDVDEVSSVLTDIEAEIINAEAKLARTKASWKGSATRAQRKTEANLRASLRRLRATRDRAWKKANQVSGPIIKEIGDREAALNQPVREAHEKLLRAEMQYVRDHPVPHNQANVGSAMDALEHQLANTDTDPEELLGRFREAIEDARTGAGKQRDLLTGESPKATELRNKYLEVLEELKDIGSRRKRGKLTPEDQVLMDEALARRGQLAVELGTKRSLSPYDEAQAALAETKAAIKRAEAAPTGMGSVQAAPTAVPAPTSTTVKHGAGIYDVVAGDRTVNVVRIDEIPGRAKWVARAEWDKHLYSDPLSTMKQAEAAAKDMLAEAHTARAATALPPGLTPEMIEKAGLTPEMVAQLQSGDLGGQRLSDLGKGEGVGDIPRLQAERDRLARQFRPGGKFHEEKQARGVLENMEAHSREMEKATEGARKELEQALFQRQRAQEAIVWKTSNRAGERYVVPHGQDPSLLEQMGRGVGQERHPQSIPPGKVPPREAWATEQDVWGPGQYRLGPEDPEAKQAIPSPRSEQEAISSLRSIEQTGGLGIGSARSQAKGLAQQFAEQKRTLPERIAQRRAEAAAEVQARADEVLGPLAERAQTYTNLAGDMANKKQLLAKRNEAAALSKRLRTDPTRSTRSNLDQVLKDLEDVAKANPYLQDEKLNQVESLLHTHRAELERIGKARTRMRDLDQAAQDAADGTLGKISVTTLNNNWHALHNGPLNTGDLIMDMELYKRFNNLFELSRQPKLFGRVFNAFTNLFKTWATLSPGFHLRNFLGGIFMNTSDGVALTHQLEGAQLWRKFTRGGEEWLEAQPKRIQDAFQATFASGAGGRFEEAGILAKTQNRFYDFLSSNKATRLSQRAGTRVEGSLRLGMALDSITNGQSIQDALSRISRIHFDYSQVSQIDETMKRIIPFWTFMSRNLPLQIEQMWTKPKVYAYYKSLIRNFSLPDEEFTPDYWTRQGAWRTPVEIGGNPLYLQPDLGFTRVQSDMRLLENALTGENPAALLAQTNPMIGGTVDFLTKRDSFYNRNYGPTDYKKRTGMVGAPLTVLAKVFGQTNEAGQVSENFTNYMQSLIPPFNQAARLVPGVMGGDADKQTATKWARYGGLPVQLLTPEMQDSEYWRQYFEMQEEAERQQAMLEEAAS